MQHPDEGMIHGWLDGALSPEEAERVEHHVHRCASCAEVAAEARGLIAAASRILSALDAVPGAVIPDRQAPTVRGTRTSRRWWYSPSLAAAAAVILVVGVSLTMLQAPPSEIASALEERTTVTAQRQAVTSEARPTEGEQLAAASVADAERGAAAGAPLAESADAAGLSPPPSAPPLPPAPAPEAARALPSAPAAEPIRLRGHSAAGVTDKAVPPRLPVSPDTVRRQISELAVAQQEPTSSYADSLAGRVVAANVERPRAERRDDPPDPLTRDALSLPPSRRGATTAGEGQADAAGTGARGAAPAAPAAAQLAAAGGEHDTARVQLLVISEAVDTTLVGVMRTIVYEVRPGIRVTYQTIERRFRTGAQRRDAAAEAASADDAPGERTLLRMDLGRVQAIHWTDAAGLYHSLSGPVEQDELQRIRAALHARADSR